MNCAPKVLILVFWLEIETKWLIQVATEDVLNQVLRIPFMLTEAKQEKVKLGKAEKEEKEKKKKAGKKARERVSG